MVLYIENFGGSRVGCGVVLVIVNFKDSWVDCGVELSFNEFKDSWVDCILILFNSLSVKFDYVVGRFFKCGWEMLINGVDCYEFELF